MPCWCISGPESSPGPSHSLPARFSESDSSEKKKKDLKCRKDETTKKAEKNVQKHHTKDKKKDKKKKLADDDEAASDPPSLSEHRPLDGDDDDADGDGPPGVLEGSCPKDPKPTKKPAAKGTGATRRPSKRPASKKHDDGCDTEPAQDRDASCHTIQRVFM